MRERLVERLKEKILNIKFLKKDGTERILKGTLKQEFLLPIKGTSKKPENPNVVCCVDVEKNEWRSFRLDSIIEIWE